MSAGGSIRVRRLSAAGGVDRSEEPASAKRTATAGWEPEPAHPAAGLSGAGVGASLVSKPRSTKK